MGPQALRMDLNTLRRHDVFSVEQLSSTVSEAGTNFSSDKRLGQSFYNMIDYVADRIADESEIRRGKLFPYQYFAAYLNADLEVPQNIRTALSLDRELNLRQSHPGKQNRLTLAFASLFRICFLRASIRFAKLVFT